MLCNIALRFDVFPSQGGDWRAAIDDAYKFSTKFNIVVKLNYINQYTFIIKPDMSIEDIKDLKNKKIVIGL